MSRLQLEQSLDALRKELAALEPGSEDVRRRLGALIDDIAKEIEALDESEEHDSLLEQLRHQVESFEVEHPRVTNILNDIMVTLSNLGI